MLSGFCHGDVPVILCDLFVLVHADMYVHGPSTQLIIYLGLKWAVHIMLKYKKKEINRAFEPCVDKIQRSHLKNVMYPHLEHFLNTH